MSEVDKRDEAQEIVEAFRHHHHQRHRQGNTNWSDPNHGDRWRDQVEDAGFREKKQDRPLDIVFVCEERHPWVWGKAWTHTDFRGLEKEREEEGVCTEGCW